MVVALTGWGQEEDRNRSQAAGFDSHLVKIDRPLGDARLAGGQELGMSVLLAGVGAMDRLPPAERQERATALRGLLYAAGQIMDERVRGGLDARRYARQLANMIIDGIGAP